ncbi:MAG: UDP-N-acetylmuramoyl-L-alanine--D-glutamate ligase, partial [Deltaproteobacteria bacterium]|nr:UDP-N-acetylmuramoyl-L-alanine--D-glutamate ligase [Deltaproteobacteria bacterium]
KFRLFENQGPGDCAVVNVNDPVIARYLSKGLGSRGNIVRFTVSGTLDEGLYLNDLDVVYKSGGHTEVYPSKGFMLKGLHNMENIMAVIAAARLSGVRREAILKTLARFKGLRHRMEFVRVLDGAVYIDDSKGTNVGALEMALRGLKGDCVLIAGGRDKGGDYRALCPLVREKVRLMILMGEARFKMKEAFAGTTETALVDSMEEAVGMARLKASTGDTVLLSPACSSFDMFRDYKERGDRFRALVEALL